MRNGRKKMIAKFLKSDSLIQMLKGSKNDNLIIINKINKICQEKNQNDIQIIITKIRAKSMPDRKKIK